jgi:KaiC/GvpD/RAD55 family RecA-like ATPase
MSSAVRLPSELRAFLALPGPQSLLVRGPPGSGKSTLCLALLEAAPGERILVTSRVSAGELHREFPWLGKGDNGIKVVDSSRIEPPLVTGKPMGLAAQLNVVEEPDRSVRQELHEFLSLPSPIQDAWSRLPPDGPSLVVVDSWDALVEHYLGLRAQVSNEPIPRAEIERILFRRMSRAPCHLVLVLEREEQTHLDYLLNGVVVTRREMNDDRLERWLDLPKLRGIRVANTTYPYTVEGARFQCIEPVVSSAETRRGGFEPEPSPMPQYLWPGSKSLAESFGRLPLGRPTLFEAEEDVPDQPLQSLLRPILRYVLASGGRVLLVPSVASSVQELWASVEGAVPPAQLGSRLRLVDVTGRTALSGPQVALQDSLVSPRTLVPTLSNPNAEGRETTDWLMSADSGGFPGLVLLHESGLESLASVAGVTITPDSAATFVGGIQSTLAGGNLHVVMVGTPSSTLLRSVRAVAALRVRIHNRHGRVFLYGLKPWTPGFVLADAGNDAPYDLLRIV